MKYINTLMLMALCAILILGCAGTKHAKPPATDDALKKVPAWFWDLPNDPNYLYDKGTALSKDMQIALDNASESGRLGIAKQLEDKFTGLTKKFQEATGLGEDEEIMKEFINASKSVVSQVMVGCHSYKNEVVNENGKFRAYTVMELPLGEANLALYNQTKANQNMYTRFRATETWKELEAEAEKYEAWKANQGNPTKTGGP